MTDNSLKVYTPENALKWDKNGGCDNSARPWIVNEVRNLSEEGKKTLLDIGSGTGRWTRQFASFLENVVGLDISPAMIQLAKNSPLPNIQYVEGDILATNLGDKYDIVTALAMLHHTKTRKELNQVYTKIRDSLNPNGHFLFYAPHPMNVYGGNTRICTCEFDPKFSYTENFPFIAHISMEDGSTRTGSGYHHSMQEYIGDLVQQGFGIIKIEELVAEGDRIPSALVVNAKKLGEK